LVPKPLPPGQEAEYSQMAGVMCATLAWLPRGQNAAQYLTGQGVDTVLEIQLIHPGLVGNGGVNPQLRVEVAGRARLVSLRDGRELASAPLRYRGEGRTFTAWAADDAKAFRAEVERCNESLAAQSVAALLPRETGNGAVAHSANCHLQTLASH
jgi:hypothetical protein